ncbi:MULTISPECIES: peptidoglycan glycosyltransferase FtsW [unclassified Sphingomonas]|jgi:cell division protein FtsW|uniref:peptidoglycan glycosyltransferase FtsW n=1 Tax=unclassified Sphingomonas TaxID=196159 RepID=UPI0008317ECF|nr:MULTISPECIES: putative peptidoglycan glycosyltransferase FtsW [unclassified Sphingomonas]MCH4891732.1 cell division protein FtsW [Sphingomonas sp. SFZ2018-12]
MTDAARETGPGGLRGRVARELGRGTRSPIGMWFWEIDRLLLLLILLMIALGLVAVAAGSPASAHRYSDADTSFPPMYYLWRQFGWAAISLPVLIATSMLPVQFAKRAAIVGTLVLLLCLVAVPFIGHEVNGARRWIGVGISQFQPSEFLKPCFAITVAWMLSLRAHDPQLPVIPLTGLLTAVIAALLMMQPDLGQTVLFCSIWLALLMIAGISPRAVAALGAAGLAGVVAAYLFYGNARARIDAFLFPDQETLAADTYQSDMAHATLTAGGLTGTGPGGGRVKFRLPEAHTDYIFSVIGEEFGLIACAVIALLFLALIVRVFVRLLDETDAFRLMAAAGLAVQFTVQGIINMAVNTGLAPSKGMTLPFISYGGSSMIALSAGMGLLLAFTRRNPYLLRSPYSVGWSGR